MRTRLRSHIASCLLSAACAVLAPSVAQAATPPVAVDAVGDFLAGYTGPRGADLDVVSAAAFYDAASGMFSFTATMAGRIGSTADAVYVWGLNRGAGFATFPELAPGVRFDAVLFVNTHGNDGFIDLASGAFTPLAADAVQIAGRTLNVDIAASVLAPSTFTGVAAEAYTWNLWPRHTFNPANDADISDFAPDNANLGMIAVTAVPEPASWLSLMLGAPLAIVAARRDRRSRR